MLGNGSPLTNTAPSWQNKTLQSFELGYSSSFSGQQGTGQNHGKQWWEEPFLLLMSHAAVSTHMKTVSQFSPFFLLYVSSVNNFCVMEWAASKEHGRTNATEILVNAWVSFRNDS